MNKFKCLVLSLVFFNINCSDRLDLAPLTVPTEQTFFRSEDNLRQAVDDIYRQFGIFYNANGVPSYFGELMSDNTYIRLATGAHNYNEQIDGFFITSDNGLIRSMWDNSYKAIFVCNNAIDHIKNNEIELEDSEKNKLLGQAVLLRSLFYYNMVQAWGAIPYVDEKITYDQAYEYLNEEPEFIYQKLLADLKFCENVLPATYPESDRGRVTQYAASAILAKIYLILGEESEAKNYLEKIISSGNYSLDSNNDGKIDVDDFAHLFNPTVKNCKSSILEVQYLGGENNHNSNHQNQFSPFLSNFHLPGVNATYRGQGVNTPASDLIDEFEIGDPRFDLSLRMGYDDLSTGEFIEYPFTMKFFDPNWEYPGQNIEIIRYADILLMYSEVTKDPEYLNQVRRRVGMPEFGTGNYPSDLYPTLELAIEHERRIELCFEFHRFFDLKRTGRALNIMENKGFSIDENKLVFPIPLHALDVNKKLIQNPGY